MTADEAALRAYYERDEERDLVSVEGPGIMLPHLDARMADPADRAAILDGARVLERVPELVGFGPHLLATAILPLFPGKAGH